MRVFIFCRELPIAMALANVVTSNQMDELARVFVTLFDAKHLLSPLLWNMFYREVDVTDCMQTLFRGSSLGSKIMAFCFKIYGATYLQGETLFAFSTKIVIVLVIWQLLKMLG